MPVRRLGGDIPLDPGKHRSEIGFLASSREGFQSRTFPDLVRVGFPENIEVGSPRARFRRTARFFCLALGSWLLGLIHTLILWVIRRLNIRLFCEVWVATVLTVFTCRCCLLRVAHHAPGVDRAVTVTGEDAVSLKLSDKGFHCRHITAGHASDVVVGQGVAVDAELADRVALRRDAEHVHPKAAGGVRRAS